MHHLPCGHSVVLAGIAFDLTGHLTSESRTAQQIQQQQPHHVNTKIYCSLIIMDRLLWQNNQVFVSNMNFILISWTASMNQSYLKKMCSKHNLFHNVTHDLTNTTTTKMREKLVGAGRLHSNLCLPHAEQTDMTSHWQITHLLSHILSII